MIARAQDLPLRSQLEAAGRALLKHGVSPAPLAGAVLMLVDGDADLAAALLETQRDVYPAAREAVGYLRDLIKEESNAAD